MDVFDSIRPLFCYQRFVGFWMSTFRRSSTPYTFLNVVHVIAIIVLYFWLLYFNRDPRSYLVNSKNLFMSYHSWLLCECSVFSLITVAIENLTLYSYRWRLLERLTIVDRDLKLHFNVQFQYAILSRFTIRLVYMLVIKSCIIVVASYFLVIEIVTENKNIVVTVACVIIFAGCCGSGANFSMFNVTCHLFECRLYFVNLLLQQLLFDEPPNESHIVINKPYGLLPLEFNNVRWDKNAYRDHTTDKVTTTVTMKKKSQQRNNSCEPMARHDIKSVYQITKIWPTIESTTTINVHNQNANNDIELLISSYNLKTFLPIRRMITDGMVFDRNSKSDFVIQKLDRLFAIYNYIMDCFELLNATQTKNMYFALVATAITLLTAVFGKYCAILRYDKKLDASANLSLLFSADLLFSGVIPGIWMSISTMNQAHETSKIISRIAYSTWDTDILDKLLEMSRKLNARQPYIGMGPFIFNGKVVLSLCSLITSYLIMMIQFYTAFQGK